MCLQLYNCNKCSIISSWTAPWRAHVAWLQQTTSFTYSISHYGRLLHTPWVIFSQHHFVPQSWLLYRVVIARSSRTDQPRYYRSNNSTGRMQVQIPRIESAVIYLAFPLAIGTVRTYSQEVANLCGGGPVCGQRGITVFGWSALTAKWSGLEYYFC